MLKQIQGDKEREGEKENESNCVKKLRLPALSGLEKQACKVIERPSFVWVVYVALLSLNA